MCDYSLMAVPNRLAREQEELVAYRFPAGSTGLTTPEELRRITACRQESRGIWAAIRGFLDPGNTDPACAVCIPPGARLWLADIPPRMQAELGVGPDEVVTFTQISAAVNSYRDAVRFRNGRVIRLQELREGQRMKVLDLSGAVEGFEPAAEEPRELLHRRR